METRNFRDADWQHIGGIRSVDGKSLSRDPMLGEDGFVKRIAFAIIEAIIRTLNHVKRS